MLLSTHFIFAQGHDFFLLDLDLFMFVVFLLLTLLLQGVWIHVLCFEFENVLKFIGKIAVTSLSSLMVQTVTSVPP
jgi:hypothetical protein